jgi:hypothetical protein
MSRLGAPSPLNYVEKFAVEKVRRRAKDHPDKLQAD